MQLRTRLTIQWIAYFGLVLLPSVVVVGLFLVDKLINQYLLVGLIVLAIGGAFMTIKTVEKMRGVRDDERTRQWLDAALRKDAVSAEAEDRDAEKEKLLEELRGGKDAKLPKASSTPGHWLNLDDQDLQRQIVRLLKKLGRRVQRSGDSAFRGFDLVIDNNAIVQCGTGPKGRSKVAAEQLLNVLRSNPTCTAAVLVWPKGLSAGARYLARGSNLILWDADNIARLVQERKLA
jgi:hypothetical protein